MHSSPHPHFRPRATVARLALAALAVLALAVPMGAAAAGKSVAKEGTVASLGKNVLTTKGGRTLYTLSVEKRGHFICTGACLSTWHPLVVTAGTHPTGPVALGTVERPDGRTQVTFKGRPLYSFSGDAKSGQANGEGVRDVGTWHAATLAKSGSTSQPPTQEPAPYTPPYGY